jgi:hypothetical protein
MYRQLMLAAAAFAVASPAHAQVSGSPLELAETPVVTVRASESVAAHPDTATVHVGVESFAPTASSALADNAVKMERLLATIRRARVPSANIQTSSVRLYPRYDGNPETPRLIGYFARNSLRVTTNDLTGLGKLLDAVAAPGSATIGGPHFSIKNDADLRRRARQAAFGKADAEAKLLAEARGFSAARMISANLESYGSSGIVVTGRRIADPSTPIETGQLEVSASVTVQYILLK